MKNPNCDNDKHTPGPWRAEGWKNTVVNSAKGNTIVISPGGDGGDNGVGIEEIQANARLIAAAPELLETLEFCRDWFAKFSPTSPLITGEQAEHPMLTAITKAIAKAKGL